MEEKRKIKLILDTNWWIAFLLSKQTTGLPNLLLNERYLFCFSEELRNEIYSALSYARNQKRANSTNLKHVIYFLNKVVTYFLVTSEVTICRDPKDNFLLALAKDAGADFLITGDKDLLVLQQFENTRIITLAEFAGCHQ